MGKLAVLRGFDPKDPWGNDEWPDFRDAVMRTAHSATSSPEHFEAFEGAVNSAISWLERVAAMSAGKDVETAANLELYANEQMLWLASYVNEAIPEVAA